MRRLLIPFLLVSICWSLELQSQTNGFSKGKWAKIATLQQGMHALTGKQIKQLGFSLPISSNKLQIWGLDASTLVEKVGNEVPENKELAIQVLDGGDGWIDALDTCLFYSQGVVAKNHTLVRQDSIYFFVTVADNGKRMQISELMDLNAPTVHQFVSHQVIEQDTINLLNSGQQWLGAPMGLGLGKTAQMNFPLYFTNVVQGGAMHFNGTYLASSYGMDGVFTLSVNSTPVRTIHIPAVSGMLYDATAKLAIDSFDISTSYLNASNQLNITFTGSSNSTGWLDNIDIAAPVDLNFNNKNAFYFERVEASATNAHLNFQIQNADASTKVWDLTNVMEPMQCKGIVQNNAFTFCVNQQPSHAFWATKQNIFFEPILLDSIPAMDLRSLGQVDYIMVCPSNFISAAKKLQNFHQQKNGFKVVLVDPLQIYNAFSGGQTTPIAIRNFLQYLQQKAKANAWLPPQYLLLFGVGNFDLKKIDLNKELPVYESKASNEILSTYSSDDFYGILNAGEDITQPNSVAALSIAIGRLPVRTVAEADTVVGKIMQYQQQPIKGVWQNQLTWIADDEDYNLHLQDAEEIVQHLQDKQKTWDHKKIYLDAYAPVMSNGGLIYPDANADITASVNKGTVLLNYTGHGNYLRLSEQAVISAAEIQSWDNAHRLPILVTASCDFAPYDQPQLRPIGFDALLQNSKGIIGLVAANRLVFAYSNKKINDHFIQSLLVSDTNGNYLSLGKALQKAKQLNWQQNGDRLNAFKFNLMGDPALRLPATNNSIAFKQINQKQFTGKDTLVSGQLNTIQGQWIHANQLDTSFKGMVDFVIWDAKQNKTTLGNMPTSIKTNFSTQEMILFKGRGTVQNGSFQMQFLLPPELNAMASPIRIEAFAFNDSTAALGIIDSVFVQSNGIQNNHDSIGPLIKAYINDSSFVQYGWVSNPAKLLLTLSDSAGIQSAGTSLGHDLLAILDEDVEHPIILNNYFVTAINQYQSGSLEYPLPSLSEGQHRLIIKAWDMVGNLSKDTLYFMVPKLDHLMAKSLMNSPNPVTQDTKISFEFNQIHTSYTIRLEIVDVAGRVLVSKNSMVNPVSNKMILEWNGRDNTGAQVPAGLYFYRIIIENGKEKQILTNKLIKI